ncbi:hypothetical protein GX51_05301 [Blastomyces parvus]|uniref:Uncharacterized protein n=1 Tax=Blastomyces parvus TaxID=2060905 RepID=A0A2B7WXQ0_9EURO|nr:hypothetical protein GX51_05301 [Blastomyces parvus]
MEKREKKRHCFLRFCSHRRNPSPSPAQPPRLTTTAVPRASQTPSAPASPDPLPTLPDPSLSQTPSAPASPDPLPTLPDPSLSQTPSAPASPDPLPTLPDPSLSQTPSAPASPDPLPTLPDPSLKQTPSAPASPDPLPTLPDPSLKGTASVVVAVDDGSRANPHKTNEALKLAVENHIKGLTPAEQAVFRNGPPEDELLARAAKLDAEHKEASSFRPHTQKITKGLQLCDLFMRSVQIGIQANPDISAIVLGGVRLVLDIGLRFVTFLDRLTDMISRLAAYLKALETYGRIGDERITVAAAATYGEILRFCQRVNSIFASDADSRKSTISIFVKQFWEPFETTFGEIDSNIKHHLDVIKLTANALQLEQLDWLKTRGKSEDKDNLLMWLAGAGVDFDKRHNDVFSKKHPGTADWLLNSNEFKSWINSPESSLLWCYAGTGKSVIASNVIEHFDGKHLLDATIGVPRVYYHHEDGSLQDLSLVIAGMLLQICRKLVLKLPTAKIIVMSRKEDDIADAFKSLNNGVFLEVEIQPKDTTQDIETYVTESVRSLRKGSYGKKLHLNAKSLEGEIINCLIQKSQGIFLWVYFQLEHLCEVSEARQDRQIREALDCLPSGLNETYMRMLHDIEAQTEYQKRVAQNTLMWILNAKRPLTRARLKLAVSLSLDPDSDFNDIVLVDHTILVKSCRNLVDDTGQFIRLVHYSAKQFLESSHLGKSGLKLSPIQNTHDANELLAYTCLSYLRNISFQGPWSYAKQADKLMRDWPFCLYAARYFDFHVERSQCARRISERCLASIDIVLKNQDTTKAILLLRRIQPPHDNHNLEAAASWLRTSRTAPISIVYSSNLIKVVEIAEKYCMGDLPADALHLAAANGDEETTRSLINCFWETNKLDDQGNCALYYACESGHTAIVSMLLEHRADPNVACGFHGSPLQAASARGHQKIVKILLDYGAQNHVRNTESPYSSALDASIGGRNQEITRLLIDSGVDINAPCGPCGTALQTALGRFNYDTAKMLLDEGADVNANTARFGTALAIASTYTRRDVVEMVELMLDRGADINAVGGWIGSPLQAAISKHSAGGVPHMALVNLLLERGADVNAGDESSGTALMVAAAVGIKATVELLLDKGANVNAQGGASGSALIAAVQCHDPDNLRHMRKVVKLLLDRGADINARDDDCGTALYYASSRGLESIVELLIARKADVNIVCLGVNGGGGTPLAAALRNGHMKIAAWLIAARPRDLGPAFRRRHLEPTFVPFEHAYPDCFDFLDGKDIDQFDYTYAPSRFTFGVDLTKVKF